MSRIRSIKPAFFLHDGLAAQSPINRLLFIGLWTLADREGRLEDRPKRIKAALFPWDDLDVDAALDDLQRGGFLVRYEVDGEACIHIPGWAKHQRPHVREAQSDLPPPPEKHNLGSAQAQPRQCSVITKAMESTGEIPAGTGGREGKGREGSPSFAGGDEDQAVADFALTTPAPPEPTPDDLRQLWNRLKAPEQSEWRETGDKRARAVRARLRERPLYGAPHSWEAVIKRIARSSFCRGQKPGSTWVAGPEFLLRPDTATKALEGQYDDRGPSPAQDVNRPRVAAEERPMEKTPGDLRREARLARQAQEARNAASA